MWLRGLTIQEASSRIMIYVAIRFTCVQESSSRIMISGYECYL